MSVQGPILSSILSATLPFNVHLDPADQDLVKKKAEECKGRQKNALLAAGQMEPYVKIIAALEESLRDGTGTAFTKPLRTQVPPDRERRMLSAIWRPHLVVPKVLGIFSPTTRAGSQRITIGSAKVPVTISLDVVVSSPVPTPSVQSPQALLTGRPGELPFQVDATAEYPLAHEVHSS